jgi:hypothetical protein
MILEVVFKTPDAVREALSRAIDQEMQSEPGFQEREPEENTLELHDRIRAAEKKLEQWVRYGEYVTVVFDLDAMTASVK